MRRCLVAVVLALLLAPALAQDSGAGGGRTVWKSAAYQVEVTVPSGWKKTLDEPKASGAWVDLVKFKEPNTNAEITVSYQASQYRTSEQMFAAVKKAFHADTSLAIFRDETRTANERRPAGIYMEYRFQGDAGPEHAAAAFWLHLGRRYRIYGKARETAWRTIGTDIESLVSSLALTGRAFSKDTRNFKDEAEGYEMYFPETFEITLPARGARVIFNSSRLSVAVYVYVSRASGNLEENVDRLEKNLESQGSTIQKRSPQEVLPGLGLECVSLTYEKKSGGNAYDYRETVYVHRERFYRFVLGAAKSRFAAGEEHYDRMVRSISLLR